MTERVLAGERRGSGLLCCPLSCEAAAFGAHLSSNTMKVLPANRDAWFALLLFPFMAFVLVGPLCFFVWLALTEEPRGHWGANAEAALPVAVGLLVCIPVFILAAMIQFIARRRSAAVESLGFGLMAIVILWFWILPMSAS